MTSSGVSLATAAPTSPVAEAAGASAASPLADSRRSTRSCSSPRRSSSRYTAKASNAIRPADQPRNLREQLVEIEDAGHLAAQIEERREHLLLADVARRLVHGLGARRWGILDVPSDYTCNFMDALTLPLDYAAIERILPHRYPFLLVDRITEFEPDKRIVGIKNVTLNERYLAPATGEPPVLPPTILTEAIAQVGAILILAKPENRERLIYFMGIERVRYRRPVHPGDVVDIEALVRRLRSRMGVLHGVARVDGKVVVEGTMTFALGPQERERVRSAPPVSE